MLICPICRQTFAGERPKGRDLYGLYGLSTSPCARCQERIDRFLDDLAQRRKESTQ
jgi:hypothetical protein